MVHIKTMIEYCALCPVYFWFSNIGVRTVVKNGQAIEYFTPVVFNKGSEEP